MQNWIKSISAVAKKDCFVQVHLKFESRFISMIRQNVALKRDSFFVPCHLWRDSEMSEHVSHQGLVIFEVFITVGAHLKITEKVKIRNLMKERFKYRTCPTTCSWIMGR